MKSLFRTLALCLACTLLLACATTNQQDNLVSGNLVSGDAVWIDVRSDEEYQEQHLEGAINIEYTEILEGVASLDKDTEILLYCGSGRRAGLALEALEAQGFTNVTNHGGLADVLEQQAN